MPRRLSAAQEFAQAREGQATNKAGKKFDGAVQSIRDTFKSKGEDAALKAFEAQRDVFGEDVEVEVTYDENDKPKLTFHGLRERKEALSAAASAKTPPPQ